MFVCFTHLEFLQTELFSRICGNCQVLGINPCIGTMLWSSQDSILKSHQKLLQYLLLLAFIQRKRYKLSLAANRSAWKLFLSFYMIAFIAISQSSFLLFTWPELTILLFHEIQIGFSENKRAVRKSHYANKVPFIFISCYWV